eukprot:CAMPEP_0171727550 /NCGR_PEP_ID=MMETSP0991-20121206/26385_1 /TAXON_ID=483369 /ORGANISM="non described non described, Strain CCMP2098" /LENGTH=38 /DNA_ID= /DNA_START= /DNA_END= /DNA_ORIENTATION=
MAKELLETVRRRHIGGRKRQIKGMQMRSTTLVACTILA